ncbi:DUF4178 domain-containing protein [Pseudaestuariivita atlantica]|uniref:DUF4178 domain-containing protein n=1 Tax=Pseudaestuariivita atlantica TaxID=1317121 RepID=A0A0L1JNJ0_9RHOB|nr:DUF4178 domain-containing protein [Pseudaestuariivita atlantica]KNG93324.1 hypothetical protein ATO11_12845 [Pseudaestuariivita atlantica]
MTDVRSINCTSCGAGLDVLGGGRVTTHICGYCGAELATNADYKVLRKFADMPRPVSPFHIGMRGRIKGVEWTIIGTLGMEERWDGQVWVWTDHMLFSPTHGYAWLTVEDGHLTFTRRLRGVGTRVWMSERWVETAEHPPTVKVDGKRYKYYETSNTKVTFAEGEFNYRPEVGQTRQHITALGDDAMLSFSENDGEREVDRTEYLPQSETFAAFGATPPPPPATVHPTQPYVGGAHEGFLARASFGFAALSVVLSLWFWLQPGERALDVRNIAVASLPQEFTFDVPRTGQLTRIRINSDVRDGWAFVEAYVTDPEDRPVFETGRTVERYRGVSEGERWTEGSGGSTIRFRPELAGPHTIELAVSETGKWFGSGIRRDNRAAIGQVGLTVTNGVASGFWTLCLAGLFVAFGLWQHAGRFLHDLRRWSGTDWTDED